MSLPCTVHTLQVYVLMWVPPVIAAGLLAVHQRVVYQSVKIAAQPSMITTAVWVLAEVALPHLMHHYMHRAAQLREVQGPTRVTCAAGTTPEAAASCKQTPASGKDREETRGKGAWGAGCDGEGVGEPHIPSTGATAAGPAGADTKAQASASEADQHPAIPLGSRAQAPQVRMNGASTPAKGPLMHVARIETSSLPYL
jgi:hypothetical protein